MEAGWHAEETMSLTIKPKSGCRWDLVSLGEVMEPSGPLRLGPANWREPMETQTKTFPDLVVVAHDKGKQSEPERGLKRRVLAHNDKLLVAAHEMVKGWVGKAHSHPHDQVVCVVHVVCGLRAKTPRSMFKLATPSWFAAAWNTVPPQSRIHW
jgi:hypothetical protein